MNPDTAAMSEWQGLADAWQTDPPPAHIDEATIVAAIRRRSRRMLATQTVNLILAAIALILCLHSLLTSRLSMPGIAAHAGLIALVIGWTGWSLWRRRQQWRVVADSPLALLDFETGRVRTALQLTRTSIWITTGLAVALLLVTLLAPGAGAAATVAGLYRSLWAVLATTLASALIAFAWSRGQRRQLDHLRRLRDTLLAEPPPDS